MQRRQFLFTPLLAATAVPGIKGLTLNEDANHFFVARRKLRLTREIIRSWVDQYAGTQVTELVLNVNAMRSSFASTNREAWWTGFDPRGGPDQPFLSTLAPASKQIFHDWIRCAWQMNEDNLDLYSIWIPEIRRRGISPWVSVRMNDLHDVDNESHPMHSSFWRDNKQYRRVPYRAEQRDKGLDYAQSAVRDYYFRYLEEVCERYDFDTLELDWMRHGFHFRPGFEAEGGKILSEYHRQVRRLLGTWSRKRGHPIRLAVRVPSSPRTAKRMGMDAVEWAGLGLVDYVTVTNYWRTVDTNMPMDEWRRLLPKAVKLAAGMELGCNAFFGSKAWNGSAWQSNSIETVRGAAASYLDMGADKIYLFNYMDADTTLDERGQYPALLRECGDLSTLAGKTRRHVVTYQDTWAPGEAPNASLPVDLKPGRWWAFRLLTGAIDGALKPTVRLGLLGDAPELLVRVNGVEVVLTGKLETLKPGPATPVYSYDVKREALQRGETVIEITPKSEARLEWVELALE